MFKQAAHTHRHKFEGTHFHPVLASCQRLQWYLPASCVTQPYLINCRLRHSHKTLQYVREREKESVCVSVKCVGVCSPRGMGNEFTSQECTAESGCFYIKTPTVCFLIKLLYLLLILLSVVLSTDSFPYSLR